MLLASSSGSWVLGLVFIGLIVWAGVWVVRRVMTAVRGVRHVPEQALAAEQPNPMQMSIEPQSSGIVLPPPRRTRQEEEEHPQPSEPPRSPHLWERRVIIPQWLLLPLAALGLAFVVFVPFGIDRYQYGAMVVVAALFGVWQKRRTRHRWFVLQRRKHSMVLWLRWGDPADDASEPPPVIACTPSQDHDEAPIADR
jgi:hypothetical protein